VPEALVTHAIELPGGALTLLQPAEAATLPDDGPVEWAPLAPYAEVLWRSGVELARELDAERLRGLRMVELGCGLALPSLVAARAGATALATDADAEALPLVARNARENGLAVETAAVDWTRPDELVERAPFDLVLAADVLYEQESVEPLLTLLPRLAPVALLATPQRAPAAAFLELARGRWTVRSDSRGVVGIHRLTLA
jgi:predicted nicotinamide N-methyase